ncbi:hypothetical protein RN22_04075 [Grimontia sp. AD028]|nr:hypothetical protein RN22_04075 [Grimontia sp. AD028]
MTLECVDIASETHDVKSFYFRIVSDEQGPPLLWPHRPGQFVTLRLWYKGTLIPRSYTVSSPPTRPSLLSLTIKRDPAGLVSRFMHDRLSIGDRLSCTSPGGNFDLYSIKPRRKIVMLTGGAGITPAMSMLRYLYDMRATENEVIFIHSARTPDDIIFRDETLLMSKQSHTKVHYVCAQHAEPGMENGFLSKEILQRIVPDIHDSTILTCGPTPYMDAVKSMLNEIGVDMNNYHEESFGDPSKRFNPGGATPKTLDLGCSESTTKSDSPRFHEDNATSEIPDLAADTEDCTVRFSISNQTLTYSPQETLLQVATRAGIAVATNCQMGLCGTCKAKCTAGNVVMDTTEGLTDEDMSNGYVLTCVGRANGLIDLEL